jgi:chromosome segregation ATPase
MVKTRGSKQQMGTREKAAQRRLEHSRVRHARTENRVADLRQRLARAEEKLTRRATRLAEAEAALKSVAALQEAGGRTTEEIANEVSVAKAAKTPSQEVVADVTTPQEAIEELTVLSASSSAPIGDGTATSEHTPDERVAAVQEKRIDSKAAARSRRKTTSRES